MTTNLDGDLKRLRLLAYNRSEWGESLIRKFHQLPMEIQEHPDFPLLKKLRSWLFVPISLWPANLDAIGHQAIALLQAGLHLDPQLSLVLNLLAEPPSEAAQGMAAQHEHRVQGTDNEHLIPATHKFSFRKQELEDCEDMKKEWQRVVSLFDIAKYQDETGLIRRHFVQERHMQTDWPLDWKCEKDRFYAVFNTFCHRWYLYGMRHNIPLVLKATVEMTSSGTQVFIPAYWSLDPKRDFKWGRIAQMHRTRGVSTRQGEKLYANQLARLKEALRAKHWMHEAKTKGIKGGERIQWIMKRMGWDDRNDSMRLRRLLKLAGNEKIQALCAMIFCQNAMLTCY